MKKNTSISRRGFLGSVAAITATSVVAPSMAVRASGKSEAAPSVNNELLTADGKPNSKFNGVQIGAISNFIRNANSVEDVIKACVEANLSSIELRQDLEPFIGKPVNPLQASNNRGGGMPAGAPGGMPAGMPAGIPGGRQQRELTEEEKAIQAKYDEELKAFRNDPATMVKWAEVRKKFNDAGIAIHIVKWTAGSSDEELDYSFKVAKTLGAYGISTEGSDEECKTFGKAAERNGMYAIYHNHAQYASMTVDEIQAWLDYSPANMLNFDSAHYFGFGYDNSTKLDPIQFIEKFHDRIVSIHIKDKTSLNNEFASNQNQVWGQGETPTREILQYVRDKYPTINCDIELEYSIPKWSTSNAEIAKCVRFSREALI